MPLLRQSSKHNTQMTNDRQQPSTEVFSARNSPMVALESNTVVSRAAPSGHTTTRASTLVEYFDTTLECFGQALGTRSTRDAWRQADRQNKSRHIYRYYTVIDTYSSNDIIIFSDILPSLLCLPEPTTAILFDIG